MAPPRGTNVVLLVAGGVACVDVSTKKHPNAQTQIDAEALAVMLDGGCRWSADASSDGKRLYVSRSRGPDGKKQRLHRLLSGVTDEKVDVDHHNKDTLDNRKANLRAATHHQNMRNNKSHEGASSRFIGVSWCEAAGAWMARRRVDGVRTYLGVFEKEEDAARAYDAHAKGDEFSNMNFPNG